MTTINELKKERDLLYLEKGKILNKQREEISAVKRAASEEIDGVQKKITILNNQMNNIRKPGVAKNVRAIKKVIRL